jgi:hypothetical protein
MTLRTGIALGTFALCAAVGLWWGLLRQRLPGAHAGSARTWPQGTAVAVDDLPISIDQVDADSVFVERIEPAAAAPQLRRLALTNISLPRVLARALDPGEHARVRAEAMAAHAQLVAGRFPRPPQPDGALGDVVRGGFSELGLVVWGTAMDLAHGQWSEVVEEPGRFVLLRLLARHDAPVPMATVVEIDALVFPWIDLATAPQDIEAAFDRHELTIVDPAFESIVPELIKIRMRKEQP